jgi:Protein of unknown function (DUF3175)
MRSKPCAPSKLRFLESVMTSRATSDDLADSDENAHGKHMATNRKKGNWVASVKTTSTYPPPGLFNRSAAAIARSLASKKVSPLGPGSGMRMLSFYINRAGRNLTAERRSELNKAKSLLSAIMARRKKGTKDTSTARRNTRRRATTDS